jgi:putative hemolysin
MRPVIWLLSLSTNALVRLLGGDPQKTGEGVTSEELRSLVTSHEALGEEARRIVDDVFAATERTLREVMCPRVEVDFVDRSMGLPEAAEWVRDRPYSRYPVMDGTFDSIVGFLHVRDLLVLARDDPRTVDDVRREILKLPTTKALLPAATMMRQSGIHLAVVVDEYGGTDGIVTLEDLVEEIVGEIRDEYDVAPADSAEAFGPHTVSGGLTIEDFADRTGVVVPDGDYETVAGYVIAQLGRIPTVGDAVLVEGACIEVSGMTGRRVTRVTVTPSADEHGQRDVGGVRYPPGVSG